MSDIVLQCPFCEKNVTVSLEMLGKIVKCPHCKEGVFVGEENFTPDQIQQAKEDQDARQQAEEAARMAEEAERASNREQRERRNKDLWSRTHYKFLILKFDEAETVLNSLARSEGWKVVSHSTVFLSETSGSLGGFGAGTRVEGIAVILRRDDIP